MRHAGPATRLLALAPLVLVAAACRGAPRPVPPTAVTGRVFLPAGAAVPAGAVLELRVLDITPVVEAELGSVELRGPLASPVSFAVPFDWIDVDPSHSFALRARVVREGRDAAVLFATGADTAVLTRGAPQSATLSLAAVQQ